MASSLTPSAVDLADLEDEFAARVTGSPDVTATADAASVTVRLSFSKEEALLYHVHHSAQAPHVYIFFRSAEHSEPPDNMTAS